MSKRKFDEMAAADLARVFFRTISEKSIIDARPKIRHLKHKVQVLESRLAFYEQVLPPCVVSADTNPDELYCSECDRPLSCMDWKMQRCVANCQLHETPVPCSECDAKCCGDCIRMCPVDGLGKAPS
uniref:Uncharacterized protein n=1 Tax=viral metagenome TaxID=1070528 RepID=A0A6C0BMA0_9ZZZZ